MDMTIPLNKPNTYTPYLLTWFHTGTHPMSVQLSSICSSTNYVAASLPLTNCGVSQSARGNNSSSAAGQPKTG